MATDETPPRPRRADPAPGGGDTRNEAATGHPGHDPQGPGKVPHLGDDRQFFDEGRPGNLAEQRELLDEEGEDIRQYTGEPVETEDGWVVPHQQNVGPGNEAGGGEFPNEPGDAQDLP